MEKALSGLARMTNRKSTKDLSALDRSLMTKEYPVGAGNYEVLDDCGRGVSATVYRCICRPLNEIVAVKRMNLESLNCDLEEIIHEAQTMKAYNHPNVLPLYCSFVSGQELWMVMPFVSGGSVLHIMKYAYPDGLDEITIATIMRDVLRALEYVHRQGGIHRDIKAGNILIDKEGHVQLGDFGVAASLERSGSWGHDKVARMTFVGTPCWMAPEVMEQTSGYDSSADIWSFGITLLEMAHGHAPFAKFPPMKVLLMTLQNPPPSLEDKGKKHFSKAMREVVTRCLQKDPRLRPTATQLLEHKFFKQARDDEFLMKYVMSGLPPLGERVQEIRQGTAATNQTDNDRDFVRSQDEYKKGISTWNFDVAALKAQAALEPDDLEPPMPTITEAEEGPEGTLSGLIADRAAAAFMAAQGYAPSPPPSAGTASPPPQGGATFAPPDFAPGVPPTPSLLAHGASSASSHSSAFASLSGQQLLLRETSNSAIPPATYLGQEAQAVASAPASEQAPPVLEPKAASHTGASEATPLSPGTISPGLSRESSVQGPLVTAVATPVAVKQKIKQQGRFQIYEPGAEPPPMVHGPAGLAAMSVPLAVELGNVARSHPGIAADALLARSSEDGVRRAALEGQESMFDEAIGGEPKKKGRFLVVEQAGLSKVSSAASLTAEGAALLAAKAKTIGGDGSGLGKPPAGPSQMMPGGGSVSAPGAAVGSAGGVPPAAGGATLPVAVVLPRLLELMDHVSQQQAAMQRLVAAVQEAERGKPSPQLTRVLSSRSLLSPADSAIAVTSAAASRQQQPQQHHLSGGVAAEASVDADAVPDALRARVSELETDNARLKARVAQLEALLAATHAPAGLPNGLGSSVDDSVTGLSPGISPRDTLAFVQAAP